MKQVDLKSEYLSIPSYEIKRWNGKKNQSCLVIPVINEGPRIKNLLSRMTALKIHDVTDIIIVDGGSTDNSLNNEVLDANHVQGLLLKTGAGKLSAQLLCAYAFVLENNYEYIITIDGNDKDDPDTVPKFLAHLESGYDFIQASRFVKGGVAENTPLIRDLAIRLIHAPLLSIASGFKWTDTTQGYRGYSRKMLMDPEIGIFRPIFKTYELLAYLSYRAPVLGYKCLEVATARRYPVGEVPTKISSFKGNLEVFKILLKTCLGHYNP